MNVSQEGLSVSSIDGDGKLARLFGGEEEDGTSKTLGRVEGFSVLEVVNRERKVSKVSPEFEVEVSSMDNIAFSVSVDDRCASFATLDFVEHV